VHETLRQLFPELTMVVGQQTNSLFVRGGSKEQLQQLEAVLKQIDRPGERKAGMFQSPDGGMGGTEGAADVPSLEKKLREAEQNATGLAKRPLGEYVPADRQALRQRLRREVESAFEARQQLQRAQLHRLRERLERIEQSIAARERIRDRIIDHRVDELLDPNLRWGPTGVPTDPSGGNPYDPMSPPTGP
jgi:hypothetical protein